MSGSLLGEHELMLNVGLGALSLHAFTLGFESVEKPGETVTLWHLATVLPLVYHATSRRAISKRQLRSGLRSILTRDPQNDMAQNEAIFNLTRRVHDTYPRTKRSLNCAIAWGMLYVSDGEILPLSKKRWPSIPSETQTILRASTKLGTWAGQLSSFEYFTVLGLEFRQ